MLKSRVLLAWVALGTCVVLAFSILVGLVMKRRRLPGGVTKRGGLRWRPIAFNSLDAMLGSRPRT
jgi:hypothetical protein